MIGKIFSVAMIAIGGILFLSSGAVAGSFIPMTNKGKENSKAAEHSPIIDEAGDHLVLSPPGLEKIVFIHYTKDFAKPPWAGGGNKEKESTCYAFLGNGVRWRKMPVHYVINPNNNYGLSEDFVTNAIVYGAEIWDMFTGAELFGSYDMDYYADWDGDTGDLPDGRNELIFGDYGEEGVIAVTVAWGYFSGPPGKRMIVEFDILFNTYFHWGDASSDPFVMDLQNIATHELGHAAGLGDLYDLACSEETMYGYSDYGETEKRNLNPGDIAGIQELYGQ